MSIFPFYFCNCSQWKVKQFCNYSTCLPLSKISCQIQDDKGDWVDANNSDCTVVKKAPGKTVVLPKINDHEFLNHIVYVDASSARPTVDFSKVETCCSSKCPGFHSNKCC